MLIQFFLQFSMRISSLSEPLFQPLLFNSALSPFRRDLFIVLLELLLLLLQHVLHLHVHIYLFCEISFFILELGIVLFDPLNFLIKYLNLLLLVQNFVVVSIFDVLNLLLPLPCLTQRTFDSKILRFDLFAWVPNHGFDEELAVTELADFTLLRL